MSEWFKFGSLCLYLNDMYLITSSYHKRNIIVMFYELGSLSTAENNVLKVNRDYFHIKDIMLMGKIYEILVNLNCYEILISLSFKRDFIIKNYIQNSF